MAAAPLAILSTFSEATVELKLSHQEGYVLAESRGPIDDTAGDLFREHLHPLVGQQGTKLVVDLAGSERINSIGIAHLVKLVTDANTHGSRVVFAAASPFVSSVFAVTRLNRFFDLAESRAAALTALDA